MSLAACVMVGRGQDSLVPAPVALASDGTPYLTYFPDLVESTTSPAAEPTLRRLTEHATTSRQAFSSHLTGKYGATSVRPVELDLIVQDRTTSPPFLPTDVALDKELMTLFLNAELETDRKLGLADLARARLYNVPDLPRRTTIADRTGLIGAPDRYNFFPRVKMELSTKLNSPSTLDRLAYIGMALVIREVNGADPAELANRQRQRDVLQAQRDAHGCHADPQSTVNCDDTELKAYRELAGRFAEQNFLTELYAAQLQQCQALPKRFEILDFQPKSSDIVEFTRGQLTQAAEFNSKANVQDQDLSKVTSTTATGTEPDTTGNTSESGSTRTLTPEVAFGLSDTFVNALEDSIEARTSGVLDNGSTFFTDLRSIANKRIGGTYEYDLMLEVQSFVYQSVSYPCVDLDADAYLVSVVRHVYDRGMTGVFTKVPEPENDKTFHQVVLDPELNIPFWRFNRIPVGVPVIEDDSFTVNVRTNTADAQFDLVVEREANCDRTTSPRPPLPRIAASGSGISSALALTATCDTDVRVEFSDVNVVDEGVHFQYTAQSQSFTIPKGSAASRTVRGNYGL